MTFKGGRNADDAVATGQAEAGSCDDPAAAASHQVAADDEFRYL